MAKDIGTLAILSENATLLSENCCSCKCFGTRMFIFYFLQWNNTKKQNKSQIWYNSTQNPKNALDKIIGTLNLIFVSTPFGKNNWNQSLPVTMNEFLKPRSDCQPKSDFCADPIEIRSYLNSLNGNELHEIRFVQIRFELHSYVVWNPIQIAFLEIRLSLDGQIGFSIAFSRSHAT